MKKNDNIINKKQKLQKISVGTSEGYTLIDYDTILYLKADNNYTTFYLSDNTKIIASKNLGYFEQKLLKEPFIRIHHSFLVNLTKIKKYIKSDGGYVLLTNKKSIPVSRSRKDALLRIFK